MAKMKLNFNSMKTNWLGNTVHLHPREHFRDNSKLCDSLHNNPVQVEVAESNITMQYYICFLNLMNLLPCVLS